MYAARSRTHRASGRRAESPRGKLGEGSAPKRGEARPAFFTRHCGGGNRGSSAGFRGHVRSGYRPAHSMDLSVAQDAETASCLEGAQGTAWAYLGRERVVRRSLRTSFFKINRDRLYWRIVDQRAECLGREKPRPAYPQARPGSSQNRLPRRSGSWRRGGSSQRNQMGRNNGRAAPRRAYGKSATRRQSPSGDKDGEQEEEE